MITYSIILFFSLLTIFGLFFYYNKFIFPKIAISKSFSTLFDMLFPKDTDNKEKTLSVFNVITNNRYTEQQMIDFFIKTKGLQILISRGDKLSNLLKNFFNQPTAIQLDYFEQIKFHKAFINFPKKIELPVEKELTIKNEIKEDEKRPIANMKVIYKAS